MLMSAGVAMAVVGGEGGGDNSKEGTTVRERRRERGRDGIIMPRG